MSRSIVSDDGPFESAVARAFADAFADFPLEYEWKCDMRITREPRLAIAASIKLPGERLPKRNAVRFERRDKLHEAVVVLRKWADELAAG
jgi:hypothetical protein